ncbi:hypothetical protein N0V84_011418, partial [Fusarium piperis]
MPHAQTAPKTPSVKFEVTKLRVSYPDEPLEELYQRYITEGYVFMKGLLPREDVLAAREAYFTSMAPSRVLKPGTKTVDVSLTTLPTQLIIQESELTASRTRAQVERSWYSGPEDGSVRGFCNHPALKDFVARLTGWGDATLAVRRTLLRNNTPGNKAIGVHYDQSFMRYGEPTPMTAWVPM